MAATPAKPCSLQESLFNVQAAIEPMATRAINDLIGNRYVTLNQILRELRPLLVKEGVLLMQLPSVKDRSLEVTTILAKGEERMEHICAMPVVDPSPHGVGSLITYARRYTLSALFCLTTEDDDASSIRVSEKETPVQQSTKAPSAPPPAVTPKPPIDEIAKAIPCATEAQLAHLTKRLPGLFEGDDLHRLQAAIAARYEVISQTTQEAAK